MNDTDLKKWISGETDIFFQSGQASKGGRLLAWRLCLHSIDMDRYSGRRRLCS